METNNTNVSELLENRTALQCSLIGIGNAGNQILNEAVKHGIDVFAINSSYADLNNAIINKEIKSFIVGKEARGAGKNRKVAIELLKSNGMELMTSVPSFTSMVERSDVIVVTGSTAGGTGSGVAPALIQLLKMQYPAKIIIYFGILPRLTDSIQAQINTIACLDEITKLSIPYMLADLNYYQGKPNDEAYRDIQQYAVDCINTIRGKYLNKSSYGMIDENDMRTVISEPGYMSIYNLDRVTQAQLDAESMQPMMIKRIKSSPAASIMRDGIVRQMAAIINIPEDMTDSSRASDYEELIGYIGRPLAIFENYAIVSGAVGQMIVVLSGQTTPYTRISQMADLVKESEDKFNRQKNFELSGMINSGLMKSDVPAFLQDSTTKEDSEEAAAAKRQTINNFFSNL